MRDQAMQVHCLKIFLGSLGLMALTACQTLPLQNFDNSPIHLANSHETLSDVEKAMVRAGTRLGWQIRTIKPGQINAKLYEEDQMAEVTIDYSLSLYSIHYLNSENLRYSAESGSPKMIYKDYNDWVQALDRAIRQELLNRPS
jgi:hypothetical protein